MSFIVIEKRINMREKIIETYLTIRINELNGEHRKVQWIARRGAPDRLAWIPGWPFPKMPELKSPGKPLEDHQQREHKRLKKMGIKCCKLDSFNDVDKFLSKY